MTISSWRNKWRLVIPVLAVDIYPGYLKETVPYLYKLLLRPDGEAFRRHSWPLRRWLGWREIGGRLTAGRSLLPIVMLMHPNSLHCDGRDN